MSNRPKTPRTNYRKQAKQKQKEKQGQNSKKAPATPSHYLSLTPLEPLIIRSARPFDDQAGVDPARFPPPSTLAGALRTAWARANGVDFSPELLTYAVRGPLLYRSKSWLLPKPADALYFGQGDEAECIRALPKPFEAGCGSDLPSGLLPIQLERAVQGKPGSGPSWWDFADWLHFRRGNQVTPKQLKVCGWSPPSGDRRTHVALDPQRGVADEGKLFQLEGLDLGAVMKNDQMKNDQEPLHLRAHFAHQPLAAGVIHLGGKRRLAALEPEPESGWPQPPKGWWQEIIQAGGLTLTLITPALFGAGYRPAWFADESLSGSPPNAPGLRLRLHGVANERWQPHSGWDLATQKPRATRKLIPAGAVYWCELLDNPEPKTLAALWLTSLCDQEQDRHDGFGLALPAPWQPNHSTQDA